MLLCYGKKFHSLELTGGRNPKAYVQFDKHSEPKLMPIHSISSASSDWFERDEVKSIRKA